jgi:hypothetical protein
MDGSLGLKDPLISGRGSPIVGSGGTGASDEVDVCADAMSGPPKMSNAARISRITPFSTISSNGPIGRLRSA